MQRPEIRIGLVLSGCGSKDGTEIPEAVATLLSIHQRGAEPVCIAIDKDQQQVVDPATGKPCPGTRNMFSEAQKLDGGCLCGAVQFQIRKVFDAGYCHCTECRKQTGSAVLTWAAVNKSDFCLLKGTPKKFQRDDDAFHYFCGDCGSPLCFISESSPFVSVSIGALDNAEAVKPRIHQFYASKLSWFDTNDSLPRIADNTLPHPDKRTSIVPPSIVHTILYVKDQESSMKFYSAVLNKKPTLHVPGMTEFQLNGGTILGLMPEKGIKRLLGERLPDPAKANGVPRAELYLRVETPEEYHLRAIQHGAKELSPLQQRDWGHVAAYSLDADGHVLAFAKTITDERG